MTRYPVSHATRDPGRLERTLLAPVIESLDDEPKWLVRDAVPAGETTMLFGAHGSGKTWLALRWVSALVRAGETVILVDGENGMNVIGRRLKLLGYEPDWDQRLHYFGPQPLLPGAISDLTELIEELRPALVCLDPVGQQIADMGGDEDRAGDVLRYFGEVVHPAKRVGAAVLLVDHIGKPGRSKGYARGSSAKMAALDNGWEVAVNEPERFTRERAGTIELTLRKSRNGILPAKLRFKVGVSGDDFDIVPTDERAAPKVDEKDLLMLAALRAVGEAGLTGPELERAAGLAKSATNEHVRRLIQAGHVSTTGTTRNKRYFWAKDLPGSAGTSGGRAVTFRESSADSAPLKGAQAEAENGHESNNTGAEGVS